MSQTLGRDKVLVLTEYIVSKKSDKTKLINRVITERDVCDTGSLHEHMTSSQSRSEWG